MYKLLLESKSEHFGAVINTSEMGQGVLITKFCLECVNQSP
ncbi:hypothetical protein C8E03_11753 [Lachnotalea glycerini]|uniref:Uncharacterized protein n=1 Tax=Lachnotalea glycerini TaxID=1763509 RepID=A0A318EML7_9FIRM|nr:hypothetical protein [Lachnotalea glycerini]PXV85417.1 hypothetical protein C8E03_11753 [Lachnotalea glycerini]